MLKKADVDAVDICTPNYLHAPMAIAALRSGRDVLCEKPMARNANEAQQMVDAADKHDRILMVAMNNRFREDAQMLQKFVVGNELGDIQIIKAGWLRRAHGLEGSRVVHRARQGRRRRAARSRHPAGRLVRCGSRRLKKTDRCVVQRFRQEGQGRRRGLRRARWCASPAARA